jgi:hypothetical protein
MEANMTQSKNRAMWKELVAEFKKSGQTKTAWCKANNIDTGKMKYWLGKAIEAQEGAEEGAAKKKERAPENKVFVIAEPSEAGTPETAIRITIGRAVIEAREGVGARLLETALKAVCASC